MKISLLLAGFIAWMSYMVGAMISDIGETRPEYTIDWKLVVMSVLFGGLLFIWGYTTGRESK